MTLTKPSIDELTCESASKALLQEWLSGYFDGWPHSVGQRTGIDFPVAKVAFDQGPVTQRLNGTEIRVITVPGRRREYGVESGTEVTQEVTLQFQVRSNVAQGGEGNRNLAADRVAELLHAMLQNASCRRDLANRGVTRVRPRKPEPLRDKDYAVRLVSCRATLVWLVEE